MSDRRASYIPGGLVNIKQLCHCFAVCCAGRGGYATLSDDWNATEEIRNARNAGVEGCKRMAKILVQDDEEPMRDFIAAMLTSGGYECRLTETPAETLETPKADPEIALVICGRWVSG